MDESWNRVLARAESQYGLFTVTQAGSLGVAEHKLRHLTRTGRLELVHPGVLRLVGAAPSWEQRAKAVALWLQPDVTISYTSAGRLLHIDGARSDDVHVSVLGDETRGRRHPIVTVHRTRVLPGRHRVFVDGIPCTSGARTIADLAGVLHGEALEAAAESARRLGLMTVSELERTARECGSRRSGLAALRRYIELHEANPALESRLEIKTAALLREARLVGFVPQHRIRLDDGVVYRVDFARPDVFVALECDGFRWHGQHMSWKRDRRRIAALERLGWRVIVVTWDDVTRHRAETIARIKLVLDEAA